MADAALLVVSQAVEERLGAQFAAQLVTLSEGGEVVGEIKSRQQAADAFRAGVALRIEPLGSGGGELEADGDRDAVRDFAVACRVFDRVAKGCLLYTSPSPRDRTRSRMPSSA